MDGKLLKGVILKPVLIIGKSFKHLAALWRGRGMQGSCRLPSVDWTPVVAVEEKRAVLVNQLFSLTALP